MTETHLLAWATGVVLIALRVAMLFVATPIFGAVPIPPSARAIVVIGLTLGITGGSVAPITDLALAPLVAMAMHEALVGGVIATGLIAGFGAFHFGGRLLDVQIGFGVATLVDLATKNTAPLIGTLLTMVAAMVFFSVDGHHAMLRVLRLSIEKLPPGTPLGSVNFGALIAQFATCFTFGFVIVAPVVLCLLMVDFGVAFMSRTMPQMNVFVLSLSLKVIVGVVLLAIIVPLAGSTMRRVFESIYDGWSQVLG